MPMVITNPRQADNPIVLANKAFLDLTGYAPDEVIGQNCRFLQGKGTSAAAVSAIRDAIADEREVDVELLNYRKDGSAFWNQLSLSPVHDDAGELLYYFGSQIDVTDFRRVQALETSERRLLKEVDHRARNVLAVVNGIVRLSRAEDASRYATSIQQRVQALANAHTLLAERGWREVPLDLIIRQQMLAYDDRRIDLSGPPVMVSAFVVQPLALVLHELADNAANHGALSRPTGMVRVSWTPMDEYGGFELRWEEPGVAPPIADVPTGFGTAMLTGMIERQLQGRYHRQWNDTGLVIDLTVPGPVGEPGVGAP
jgi:PAS domain S-box-containing protein